MSLLGPGMYSLFLECPGRKEFYMGVAESIHPGRAARWINSVIEADNLSMQR